MCSGASLMSRFITFWTALCKHHNYPSVPTHTIIPWSPPPSLQTPSSSITFWTALCKHHNYPSVPTHTITPQSPPFTPTPLLITLWTIPQLPLPLFIAFWTALCKQHNYPSVPCNTTIPQSPPPSLHHPLDCPLQAAQPSLNTHLDHPSIHSNTPQ